MALAPPEQIDTRNFAKCAAAAVDLSEAHYLSSPGVLSVHRSVRNWESDCKETYLYQLYLDKERVHAAALPPARLDTNIEIRLPSLSGKHLWVVKKLSDENGYEMEFWDEGALIRRSLVKEHGRIIADDTFGKPQYNSDESYLVYAAEPKSPPTSWLWDDDNDDQPKRRGKHVLGEGYEERWGEQFTKQSPLLDLYILSFETGKIGKITNVPTKKDKEGDNTLGGVTLGQPVWHPEASQIAYTGWDAGALGRMPRRLGMIYCKNRPSQVYVSNVGDLLKRLAEPEPDEDGHNDSQKDEDDQPYLSITSEYPYAVSPQYKVVSSNAKADQQEIRLVFLANPNGFVSHDGCMGLYQWSASSMIKQCLVPVVQNPQNSPPYVHGMGFPGLFASRLLPQCVSSTSNNNFVVISTLWGSFQRLVRINMIDWSLSVLEIMGSDPLSSQTILCQTSVGDLVISESAQHLPARVWHLENSDWTSVANESGLVVISNPRLVKEFPPMAVTNAPMLSRQTYKREMDFELHLLTIKPPVIEGVTSNNNIQALLCLPKHSSPQKKVPLVVIPHGGPHSCSMSNYVPGVASLASKYALVFPNYRGSTGFGQTSLESLLSHIGNVDVQDVMACTKHTLDNYQERIDARNVGICGGSHGGFLTAHCTGQFTNFFKAAAMRNPVINIASMVTATDIPDWCYGETLASYDYSKFRGPTSEEMQLMYAKSPIQHVHKVRTPTLVALGMADQRVPPSQGQEWYYTLRSSKVETQLLVYPDDCHSLDGVTTEADHWLHIQNWFEIYFVA